MFKFVLTIFISLLLVACQQNQTELKDADNKESADTSSQSQPTADSDVKLTNPTDPAKIIQSEKLMKKTNLYRGTVRYFDLEGGFFGIICDDGQKFLPMGLSAKHSQDGAVIEFSGELIKDMMTIQQWGQPFQVKAVRLIKQGTPVSRLD